MTTAPAYPHEVPPTGAAAAFAAGLRAQLPRLETARLVLRAPELEDFQPFAEIMLSDRAAFMVDEPLSREDAWFEFTHCVAGWLLRGHGMWTVETRAAGEVVGFVLVHMEPGDREPELGWFLTEAGEGHGYATEAAEAARAHVLETLALPSLVSYIDPPNVRSVRLAERLGALRDEAAEAAIDAPVLVFRHAPQPEAQA